MADLYSTLHKRIVELLELISVYIACVEERIQMIEKYAPLKKEFIASLHSEIQKTLKYRSELEEKNSKVIGNYHQAKKAQTDAKEECTISG